MIGRKVDPLPARCPYPGGVMSTSALKALWDEARVPAPSDIPRWDRGLAAVLVPVALVEGLVREDLPSPAYSIVLAMVCPIALLWRAQHPLAMLVLGVGAQTLASVGPVLAGQPYGVLYMTACVLLLPYSLVRWGRAGRSYWGWSTSLGRTCCESRSMSRARPTSWSVWGS